MICPSCHAEMGEGKGFCGKCGAALRATTPSSVPVVTSSSRCSKCGSEVAPGKKFCGACGNPVGERLAPTVSSKTAALVSSPSEIPRKPAASQARVSTPPILSTPPRVRARKPINWRKVRLAVGIPVLLTGLVLVVWYFLPRTPLPPERLGTLFDRATRPDSNILFNTGTPGRKTVLLMSGQNIWEIPTGKPVSQLSDQASVLSPDGEATISWRGGAGVLDLRSKKYTPLQLPQPTFLPTTGGQGSQNFFNVHAFSNSGALVAGARLNGSLHLWDAATGGMARVLREGATVATPLDSGEAQVCRTFTLAFSPNDSLLASGELNGSITLWKPDTGDLVASLPENANCDASAPRETDIMKNILALAFSPDGRLIASADNYSVVRIWDVATRQLRYELPVMGPPGMVRVQFSPDSRFLVSSSRGWGNLPTTMLLFWDTKNGRFLKAVVLPGWSTFDFAPDGNLVTAQVVASRVKVENWRLSSSLRIPFISSSQPSPSPADVGILAGYTDRALENLDVLQEILGRYKAGQGNGSFPDNLEVLTGTRRSQAQLFKGEFEGYRFIYKPGTPGDQGHIVSYALSARPMLYQQTGTRSFLVDQTGKVHVTEEAREATTSDAVFRSLQDATQVAAAIQNAAAAAAQQEIAPHLARAQNLFQERQYQAAIAECDAVLHIDPQNQQATNLKAQVQQTMSILGVQ